MKRNRKRNETLDPTFNSTHMKKKLENQLETIRLWRNTTIVDVWLFTHILPFSMPSSCLANLTTNINLLKLNLPKKNITYAICNSSAMAQKMLGILHVVRFPKLNCQVEFVKFKLQCILVRIQTYSIVS